jgi:hypothetical protein
VDRAVPHRRCCHAIEGDSRTRERFTRLGDANDRTVCADRVVQRAAAAGVDAVPVLDRARRFDPWGPVAIGELGTGPEPGISPTWLSTIAAITSPTPCSSVSAVPNAPTAPWILCFTASISRSMSSRSARRSAAIRQRSIPTRSLQVPADTGCPRRVVWVASRWAPRRSPRHSRRTGRPNANRGHELQRLHRERDGSRGASSRRRLPGGDETHGSGYPRWIFSSINR